MTSEINDFSLISDIRTAFPDITIPDIKTFYETAVYPCRNIFTGFPAWREIKRSGLYSKGNREMSLLNAAKVLCDEFSTLTFSEKTEIIISDETIQEFVNGVLDSNGS